MIHIPFFIHDADVSPREKLVREGKLSLRQTILPKRRVVYMNITILLLSSSILPQIYRQHLTVIRSMSQTITETRTDDSLMEVDSPSVEDQGPSGGQANQPQGSSTPSPSPALAQMLWTWR